MLFEMISDVETQQSALKNRAYGVIEVCDQSLAAIHLRPYPKLVSVAEVHWSSFWKKQANASTSRDRVLLYYNQPMLHRNFISLKYFVSNYKTSLASIAVCLSVLDYIAKLKRTDAMVAEITNKRIKDRHLSHFGWDEHLKGKRGRHWIKRFYGEYPEAFLFQAIQQADAEANAKPESCDATKPETSMPVVVSPHYQSRASHVQSQ